MIAIPQYSAGAVSFDLRPDNESDAAVLGLAQDYAKGKQTHCKFGWHAGDPQLTIGWNTCAPKQGWQPIATCPPEVAVIFGWSEQKDAGCGKRRHGHFIDNVRMIRYDVQPDRWMPIPEWD